MQQATIPVDDGNAIALPEHVTVDLEVVHDDSGQTPEFDIVAVPGFNDISDDAWSYTSKTSAEYGSTVKGSSLVASSASSFKDSSPQTTTQEPVSSSRIATAENSSGTPGPPVQPSIVADRELSEEPRTLTFPDRRSQPVQLENVAVPKPSSVNTARNLASQIPDPRRRNWVRDHLPTSTKDARVLLCHYQLPSALKATLCLENARP